MSKDENPFSTSVYSYLNLMPPPECWEKIQEIRYKYISPVKCGPHVTVIQPFFEEKHIDQITKILTKELQDIEPFKVKLSTFKHFKMKKGRHVLWMEPETSNDLPIHKIVSKIVKIFPEYEKNSKLTSYIPHLSIGDFPSEDKMKEALNTSQCKNWKPIEFEVKELYYMTLNRSKNVYEVRATIPLGKKPTKSHFPSIPISKE